MSGCSDYNPLAVRRACRSKAQARSAFASNKLPHAKGRAFINPLNAVKFAQKHHFPLVVKPNVGGFSRGAHFPIENNAQLLSASIRVKKWWPVSIVEQYLLGKNYRVVITKFGLMSVIRRYPPFVIADGRQNISALIDAENEIRRQMQLAPVIQFIPKNSAIKKHLNKQQMDFSSVPNSGEKIYLHHKIALKLGSTTQIIDKAVLTNNNIKNLQQILEHFNANILGIDVICKQGIEVDFDAQQCIFLELNSRPFLKMHDNPRYGKVQDLSYFYDKLKKIQIVDNEKY